MARKPEIGNIQLYPTRPLLDRDKNGYVLKFFCPIQQKRIRKNCGTRDKREARKVLRECRQHLLDGKYIESAGAITEEQEVPVKALWPVHVGPAKDHSVTWQQCFENYYHHQKQRVREKSLEDAASRIQIAGRIFEGYREDRGLPGDGPVGELVTLSSLEYLQDRLLDGDESRFDSRSPITVNTMIGAVMAFIRYCYAHDWIDRIPPLSKLETDEVMKGRPISREEFDQMLEAVPETVGDRSSDSWKKVLEVLWESAFRVSDVMNFSWDDERKIYPKWPSQKRTHPTLVISSTQKNKKFQEIPMLPGLQILLEKIPKRARRGWVVNPLPIEYQIHSEKTWFKPATSDLKGLVAEHNNSAIARACGVSETTVRKWLAKAGLKRQKEFDRHHGEIDALTITKIRKRSERQRDRSARRSERRLSKDRVSRIICQIGEKAKIVVQQQDEETGRRLKYASAHDLRRGCAQRLINAGISAETLKVVLRHKDFTTTERFYGATREAQSAAEEIQGKLGAECKKDELVGGLVGGISEPLELSQEEQRKLKALLYSL